MASLFDGWLSFLPGAVKQYFVNEDDWSVVEISVQIYDILWLNGHASDFMQIMASKGTQKMFTYELFDALLYEQYYTIHLMRPFLIYLVMILLQFIHYIFVLPSFENQGWHVLVILPLVGLYMHQLRQEHQQVKREGWTYLFSILNVT